MSIVRSLKKALENGSEQSLALVTTHSPYIMSVVNVLLLAAIVTEKGLKQEVVDGDSVLPSSSISGFLLTRKVFSKIFSMLKCLCSAATIWTAYQTGWMIVSVS